MRSRKQHSRAHERRAPREQGFALLISLIALAILAVLVTDLHETTGMSFSASMAARDQLRAEYLAKSGVNLTRMLIGQEKNLRVVVEPFYALLVKGRKPPQLPVWRYANAILEPFANFENSKENISNAGFDVGLAQGLGATGGSFEIVAAAENGKIGVNDPGIEDLAIGRLNVAYPLYTLMGGNQSPSKFDPLFSKFDEKGRITTRQDVLANVIDWWDMDEQRTSFDPVMGKVDSSGGEDVDFYRNRVDPYMIKNAPFDTLEELRLVRGIDDDFWATFVEPDPSDPSTRQVTIYGAGQINPNEANGAVLLARLCTFVELREQLLCNDPSGQEPLKFITLIELGRQLSYGIPFFSRSSDFVNFVTGKQDGLFGQLASLLEGMGQATMLFTPLTLPPDAKDLTRRMRRMFGTTARLITIESTGRVGHSTRKIRTVINTDEKWTPPPPNAGKLPPLGVFSYYRID